MLSVSGPVLAGCPDVKYATWDVDEKARIDEFRYIINYNGSPATFKPAESLKNLIRNNYSGTHEPDYICSSWRTGGSSSCIHMKSMSKLEDGSISPGSWPASWMTIDKSGNSVELKKSDDLNNGYGSYYAVSCKDKAEWLFRLARLTFKGEHVPYLMYVVRREPITVKVDERKFSGF